MTEKRVLFQNQRAADPELEELLRSLSRTRCEIAQTYSQFNSTNDPDLIESYVYALNSLQCRYNYLLRRVKACPVFSSAAAAGDGSARPERTVSSP